MKPYQIKVLGSRKLPNFFQLKGVILYELKIKPCIG